MKTTLPIPETETRVTSIHVPKRDCPPLGIAMADSPVPAGFPSPAEDSQETLDLARYLVRHPSTTYFMRVAGDSMTGAQIFDGDILVVDRSISPSSGDIVIAEVNGEFTVKRLLIRHGKVELRPENPRFKTIALTEETELNIWGVVTGSVKKFK